MFCVKKIINAVGLEFDPDIEVFEFSEMIGATGTATTENDPEPVEINSFEFFFFAQPLSNFEGEALGQLSSDGQSPASLAESLNSKIEINSIKTMMLQDYHHTNSKLLDESMSTPERSSGSLLEETSYDDSLSNMMVNAINMDNDIIGTNSSLTSEYQMSDPNL